MMDNQPPLTSPDGSSHGNPPERCPRPLYSRDSTQEGHTIPHHNQVDGSSHGNPPERCPRPLYSWDSTQEGHTIPHHHQIEDLTHIKEEEKETYVIGDQQPTKDFKMITNNKLEQFFQDIDTDGSNFRNSSERHLSQDYEEDNGLTRYSLEVNPIPDDLIHEGPYQLQWSTNSSNPEEPSDKSHGVKPEINLRYHSIDISTDPSNSRESSLGVEEVHT
ncbi:unnamed protein product, partial [Staurois parvus]